MNDVIKAIMEAKNLTPSRFADEIGVPRPIVSHVLAGRNKPSLDMIQKIARRFPDLGTEWILDETILPTGISEINSGTDSIPKIKPVIPLPVNPFIPPLLNTAPSATFISDNSRSELPQDTPSMTAVSVPQPEIPTIVTHKKIEKILVFYTDKSFDEYTPNQ